MATPGFDPKDLVDVALAGRDFENGFLDDADRKLDRFFATVDPHGRREELGPLRSLAWQNRAAVAMERGEPGRAAEAYRRSLEAEATNAASRWGRLFALNRAGRAAQAAREGERMVRETPEAWTLRLHWALALALAGEPEAARRELEAVAADGPGEQMRDVAASYAAALGGPQEKELFGLYLGGGGGE
jgi:tetratricopeptide (TPR) repeat protein